MGASPSTHNFNEACCEEKRLRNDAINNKYAQSSNQPQQCPVKHSNNNRPPPTECPMRDTAAAAGSERPSSATTDPTTPMDWPSECPMKQASNNDDPIAHQFLSSSYHGDVRPGATIDLSVNPDNMMAPPNQKKAIGQPFDLSTAREVSTIPRAVGNDADGSGQDDFWVYPSAQMFWNAMLRKGWRWRDDQLNENDMKHIIKIHNVNNEIAWNEVLKWEAFHANECRNPRLKRFSGRPKDLTMKARVRGWMGYELPFDRHDWVVDRNGVEVRYILDYYDGGKVKGNGEFTIIDCRPALPWGAFDRSRAFYLRWRYHFGAKMVGLVGKGADDGGSPSSGKGPE